MSQFTTLIAIRHGETNWNLSRRYQGQEDIPLNARGHTQARKVAEALTHASLDAIYTSDLKRAYQTAAEISKTVGITLHQVNALREQHFGVFQGLTGDEVAKRWPEASDQWQRRVADFGPDGGETRTAFSRRCISAISQLARIHVGGTIAVVCHGGVLDSLYRAASGLQIEAPRSWSLENAAINSVKHNIEGFEILNWGDTTHLCGDPSLEIVEHFPGP
jgi:probable phosphoglycerate mutase